MSIEKKIDLLKKKKGGRAGYTMNLETDVFVKSGNVEL
jgi:hypothetical protein